MKFGHVIICHGVDNYVRGNRPMRLKNQRDDVKYLEKLAENRLSLRPISRRYLNLIRAFEAYLNMNNSYFEHKDRVLKDTEK